MAARLKEKYDNEIVKELREQFQYGNIMQVPRLEKVVINMGVGDAIGDPRMLESAINELTAITGQKPASRKARKAISNFKLRAGVAIGCMVTLRGERMYEFLDRLFNVAMPRINDFRGVSRKAFDNSFNYNLGLREQTIFPEVDFDQVTRTRGMNITFQISRSNSREESIALLQKLGMPFVKQQEQSAA